MSGKLIVIDGADGSGKATQVQLLGERLQSEGIETRLLDFPRYEDNFTGKILRECLDGKHGDFLSVHPKVAAVLYAADRFESSNEIKQWLDDGYVVILDRYVSANMLHQGAKISDETELTDFLTWLDKMEHETFGIPRPDTIVYLEVPFKMRKELVAQDQSRKGADVAESDSAHQEASERCAQKIVKETNNWHTISCTKADTLRSKDDIHEEVYAYVTSLLN